MLSLGLIESISKKDKKMKRFKITYTYVITSIKTGVIEIEAETVDEARQVVSDNKRE